MSWLTFLRARVPLLAIFVAAEAVYLLYFVRQFSLLRYFRMDIDMGGITSHSHDGFRDFVLAFSALFVLLALAYWIVRLDDDRRTLWLVLGTGAIFAVTMTYVYPVTAIDLFTYVAQSRIMVYYHQNPVFVVPAHFPTDPIMPLSDGWSGKGAPYGPLGILIDALPAFVGRDNLLLNLVLTKLMFSAMSLGSAYVAYSILRRIAPGQAIAGALLIAWNPLILFEVSANGHNDAAMMLIALLGLQAVVEGEHIAGTIAIALSALVKYATALLLPLVVVHALTRPGTWRERIRYLALSGGGSLLLAVAMYKPFWQGTDTLKRSLFENELHIESFGSVLPTLLHNGISVDGATSLGRVLFVPIYLLALWLATRDVKDLLLGCFLSLFGFLALGAANFKIWYAVWPAVLAGVTPGLPQRVAALFLAYGSTISAAFYGYVWVWGDLRNFVDVNNRAYFLSFLPAALTLIVLLAPDITPRGRVFSRKRSIAESLPDSTPS